MMKKVKILIVVVTLAALVVGCSKKDIPESKIGLVVPTSTTEFSSIDDTESGKAVLPLVGGKYSLEHMILPDGWGKYHICCAEIKFNYSYLIGEGNGINNLLSVEVVNFDEKEYSQDGLEQVFKRWYKDEGVKQLNVEPVDSEVFDLKYSYFTEKGKMFYQGYVFKNEDDFYNVCFSYKDVYDKETLDKMTQDFNNFVGSCRIIK